MKIQCPQCRRIIPADQVNMATDLAFCPNCNEGFKISEHVDPNSGSDTLPTPPKGAWFRPEIDHVVVGTTTRSPIALFLFPFACVWSGGSLGGIYGSQIVSGEFHLFMSLFGIPFLLGSILLWSITLMAIWGKVEVSLGPTSKVFVGIGSVGWNRYFAWDDIQTVREDSNVTRHQSFGRGYYAGAILLEGSQRLTFGTSLNDSRRYFVLRTLQYLKQHGLHQYQTASPWPTPTRNR